MRIVITGASGNVGTATLLALGGRTASARRRQPAYLHHHGYRPTAGPSRPRRHYRPRRRAAATAGVRRRGRGYPPGVADPTLARPRGLAPYQPGRHRRGRRRRHCRRCATSGAPVLDRHVRTRSRQDSRRELAGHRHSHLQLQRRQGCRRTHRRPRRGTTDAHPGPTGPHLPRCRRQRGSSLLPPAPWCPTVSYAAVCCASPRSPTLSPSSSYTPTMSPPPCK